MHTGKGQVLELILRDGWREARIACSPDLIPSPGQYVLAGDGSGAPLAVPLFQADSAPPGFHAAAPIPDSWSPGLELHLRGPLGRGFSLPLPARKVGLIAFDDSIARLNGLIRPALRQDAAVVLVCAGTPEFVPDDVEVQPLSALQEIAQWADYVAFDAAREHLPQLRERLGKWNPASMGREAEVFIRTPVPCGGLADCGVCAVRLRSDWKLACKDGPVFAWREVG